MSKEGNSEVEAAARALRQGLEIDKRITWTSSDFGAPIPIRTVTDPGNGVIRVEVARDILDTLIAMQAAPRRRQGTAEIYELESFTAHVNRYKGAGTMLWASPEDFTITAVYNDHPESPEGPVAFTGWRDFQARYVCPRSAEWLAWTERDGKAMSQDSFADFVETRLEDLVNASGYPLPTEMLTMARDLVVMSKGTFRRQINVTTGASVLECKTETETGSTVIPRAFMLAIPVFEGGTRYQVEARIRFEMREGRPMFSFVLHRRREIERDAFNDARAAVTLATGLPVFAGDPDVA